MRNLGAMAINTENWKPGMCMWRLEMVWYIHLLLTCPAIYEQDLICAEVKGPIIAATSSSFSNLHTGVSREMMSEVNQVHLIRKSWIDEIVEVHKNAGHHKNKYANCERKWGFFCHSLKVQSHIFEYSLLTFISSWGRVVIVWSYVYSNLFDDSFW